MHDGIALLKTQCFFSDDDYTMRSYIGRMDEKEIFRIPDDAINDASQEPHIMHNGKQPYVVFEDTVWSSSEIPHIRKHEKDAKNNVLCANVDEFIGALKNKQSIQWHVLDQSYGDAYVELLGIDEGEIIINHAHVSKGISHIVIKDIEGNILLSRAITMNINHYYKFSKRYFVSNSYSNDNTIYVYDDTGELTARMDTTTLIAVPPVELHGIVRIEENAYIVFDATQNMRDGNARQIRVMYNIPESSFSIIDAAFLAMDSAIF